MDHLLAWNIDYRFIGGSERSFRALPALLLRSDTIAELLTLL